MGMDVAAESGGKKRKKRGARPAMNVTPLVDVVLVLLIVLMITMPAIVSQDLLNERQLDISLPEASAAAPLIAQPKEIVINVDRQGAYTVLAKPHTKADLLMLLKQAEANNPGRTAVLIRADLAVLASITLSYSKISSVASAARQARALPV